MPPKVNWKALFFNRRGNRGTSPIAPGIPSSRRKKKRVIVDSLKMSLQFLFESSDACPPLKSVVGAMQHILSVVEVRWLRWARSLHSTDCLNFFSQLRATRQRRFAYESISNISLSSCRMRFQMRRRSHPNYWHQWWDWTSKLGYWLSKPWLYSIFVVLHSGLELVLKDLAPHENKTMLSRLVDKKKDLHRLQSAREQIETLIGAFNVWSRELSCYGLYADTFAVTQWDSNSSFNGLNPSTLRKGRLTGMHFVDVLFAPTHQQIIPSTMLSTGNRRSLVETSLMSSKNFLLWWSAFYLFKHPEIRKLWSSFISS